MKEEYERKENEKVERIRLFELQRAEELAESRRQAEIKAQKMNDVVQQSVKIEQARV